MALLANAQEMCSIPGLGRCPGGGNGNPFQHSCLESSMGWATVQAAAQDGVTEHF